MKISGILYINIKTKIKRWKWFNKMTQEVIIINDDNWSKDCLVSRLKKHLATVEIGPDDYIDNLGDKTNWDDLESRKYYNRAHHYLKIGAFKPTP